MLRYLILGLLQDGTPRHGYALMKQYREETGIEVSIGNVYRCLQDLLARECIRPAANPSGADPRRLPYEITSAGCAAFAAWLNAPSAEAAGDHQDAFWVRAFLLARSGATVPDAVLSRWHDELTARQSRLRRAEDTGSGREGGGPAGVTRLLALLRARRLKHVSTDLECLAEIRLVAAGGGVAAAAGRRRRREPVRRPSGC